MIGFFSGPILRQMFLLANLDTSKHPQPYRTKICALILHLMDVGIGVTSLILGMIFLTTSQTKGDLLLNAVALHFIVDIDELVAQITPNIGAVQIVDMPQKVVLPTYSNDRRWRESRFVAVVPFFVLTCIISPIVPVGVAVGGYFSFAERQGVL